MNRQEIKQLAVVNALVWAAAITLIALMAAGILWMKTGSPVAGPVVLGVLISGMIAAWLYGPARS